MISYAVDTHARKYVVFGLATISGMVGAAIGDAFPSSISAPSTLAIFGAFYWLYDKHLWNKLSFAKLHGVKDLSGEWEGVLSREDLPTGQREDNIPIHVTISQTWSTIDIILENNNRESLSGNTRSFSRAASLSVENHRCVMLRYVWEYDNGKGFSEMRVIEKDGRLSMTGPYTSNAKRQGYIDITRVAS